MKLLIWLGLSFGSILGSYLPTLWGAGGFSFAALLCSGLGALGGIWLGYKAGQALGI